MLMVIGLAMHAFVPTEPPWMLAASDGQSDVRRIVWGGDASASATVGSDGTVYGSFTDSNPVAAMPSLHLGISLVMALALWPVSRTLGLLGDLYSIAMGLALVYLGEHYLVDVLAGAGLAAGVVAALASWERRKRWDGIAPASWLATGRTKA